MFLQPWRERKADQHIKLFTSEVSYCAQPKMESSQYFQNTMLEIQKAESGCGLDPPPPPLPTQIKEMLAMPVFERERWVISGVEMAGGWAITISTNCGETRTLASVL